MIFSKLYPHIHWWVENNGWMIVGSDEESDSLLRLIDTIGVSWEDEGSRSVEEALGKAEMFLKKDLPKRFPKRFILDIGQQ